MSNIVALPRLYDTDPARAIRFSHFPTDRPIVDLALNLIPRRPAPETILDLGAGFGTWGIAAKERWPLASVFGIDLDSDLVPPAAYDGWAVADITDWNDVEAANTQLAGEGARYDLIMGNPPFGRVIQHAISAGVRLLEPDGGRMVLLGRLELLAGQDRFSRLWCGGSPLKQVHVLSQRPSFTADGKTDKSEYAVFVWEAGYVGPASVSWAGVWQPRPRKIRRSKGQA